MSRSFIVEIGEKLIEEHATRRNQSSSAPLTQTGGPPRPLGRRFLIKVQSRSGTLVVADGGGWLTGQSW